MLLKEAVIFPKVDDVERDINSLDEFLNKDLTFEELVHEINIRLFKYSIYCLEDKNQQSNRADLAEVGIVYSSILNDMSIVVYLEEYITECFKDMNLFIKFKKVLLNILKHELIHREQFSRYKDRSAIINRNIFRSESDYYSDKQEMMAYANSIIAEWLDAGYNKDEILNKLKHLYNRDIHPSIEESDSLFHITQYFEQNSKEMKLLMKYMYEYTEKL